MYNLTPGRRQILQCLQVLGSNCYKIEAISMPITCGHVNRLRALTSWLAKWICWVVIKIAIVGFDCWSWMVCYVGMLRVKLMSFFKTWRIVSLHAIICEKCIKILARLRIYSFCGALTVMVNRVRPVLMVTTFTNIVHPTFLLFFMLICFDICGIRSNDCSLHQM